MDSHLERLRAAIASATLDMTAAELARSRKGKWSVAEILEHLYLTYTGTIKGFQRCLDAGSPVANAPSLRQRARIALVLGAGYLPSGAESPPQARPRGMAAEKVRVEISSQIAAMDDIIGRCELQYGTRAKLLNHPMLGPMSGRQWRKFHWVHGRHHLKQIERLRKESVET
jgi:Protein of unknown function (DUF1569)